MVWEDARFTGQDETVITRSTNGGATRSSPKRVNTPGGPAFTPVVAVTDSGRDGVAGTVSVTYHWLGASSSGLSPTTYFIKRFSAVAAGDSSSVDTGVAANTVFGPLTCSTPRSRVATRQRLRVLLTTGTGATASFQPVFGTGF